jgi:hypothetical protein
MKNPICLLLLAALLSFLSHSPISAQNHYKNEIGFRPLFFQNDFGDNGNPLDGVYQGQRAGEWAHGVSFRQYFLPWLAGRVESNLVRGRYRFTGYGPGFVAGAERFAYLNFAAMPEWRVSKTLFLGAGGFANLKLVEPYEIQQRTETGVLANVGLRHDHIEITARLQRWLEPAGRFAVGVGIDCFFGLKEKPAIKGPRQ